MKRSLLKELLQIIGKIALFLFLGIYLVFVLLFGVVLATMFAKSVGGLFFFISIVIVLIVLAVIVTKTV